MATPAFIHVNQNRTIVPQDEKTKMKNFGLTKKQFDELVSALQRGDEKLFEHIYLTHFEYCMNYLIKHRGAEYEDARTSTMNALLEIRKELIQGKVTYGNLAYFFTYRAGKKLFKLQNTAKATMKIKNIDGMDFKEESHFLKTLQTKEMAAFVGQALAGLCEDCRRLYQLYYYEELSWSQIAKIYYPNEEERNIKTKSDTLKRRAYRCRPKFKKLLEALIR